MAEHLHFLPLGGCGEIGMNMNLYEYGGKWLMVDCGVTFNHDLGIEILTPDPQFIESRSKNLVGLVVTHGHEDHIGAITHLYSKFKCPIYGTAFTLGLVKRKLQDAGMQSMAELHEIDLKGTFKAGPFEMEFVTMTHSIPEPNGLYIKTPGGSVFHTGDWKLDKNPLIGETTDVERLKEIGKEGVDTLVCDSTNALLAGRAGSELDVRESLADIIAQQKNRVFVACFASNVARVETAALAAEQAGRKVALVGRSLHRMVEVARECGYLADLPEFISEQEAMKLPKDQVMLICTGSQGESRAALTRIARGKHRDVRISPNDMVIFSARMIPGNEDDIHRVQILLGERGAEVLTEEDGFIHVSGHPSQDDLRDLYTWLKPKSLVPVHGEFNHLRGHCKFAEEEGIAHTILPHNGQMIRLQRGKAPVVVEEVHFGALALDGQDLVPLTSDHLGEREMLKSMGTIFITLIVNNQAKAIAPPQITSYGLQARGKHGSLLDAVNQGIEEALEAVASQDAAHNSDKIQDMVRYQVRQVVGSYTGKKPMISAHIVKIKGKKS